MANSPLYSNVYYHGSDLQKPGCFRSMWGHLIISGGFNPEMMFQGDRLSLGSFDFTSEDSIQCKKIRNNDYYIQLFLLF